MTCFHLLCDYDVNNAANADLGHGKKAAEGR